MEKFETYRFDGVFYTKEEIEAMGLSLYGYEDLKSLLKAKNGAPYEVTTYSPIVEVTHSLSDYIDHFDQNSTVFMKDGLDRGVVIDFEFFYGIQEDEYDSVLVFETSKKRDEEYDELISKVINHMYQIGKEQPLALNKGEEYKKQFSLMERKVKLLGFLPQEEKK